MHFTLCHMCHFVFKEKVLDLLQSSLERPILSYYIRINSESHSRNGRLPTILDKNSPKRNDNQLNCAWLSISRCPQQVLPSQAFQSLHLSSLSSSGQEMLHDLQYLHVSSHLETVWFITSTHALYTFTIPFPSCVYTSLGSIPIFHLQAFKGRFSTSL